ncbi:MAG TPA: acyl carrier protein [Polyangia bacterium]|jgi:acyl carrier protein|nr:acyl carrier protein [Polyangia bacterium]
MSPEEVLKHVTDLLATSFEIDPAKIKPEALLFQDLGLDSIDAIDLVVRLQEWTGRRVSEDALRGVRTVSDVVALVQAHLAGTVPTGGPGGSGQASG